MIRQRWYLGRHLEFCKKLKVYVPGWHHSDSD